MAEEEPTYCPLCRAPWVWGNDFCVQCGHKTVTPVIGRSAPTRYSPRHLPETAEGQGMHGNNLLKRL